MLGVLVEDIIDLATHGIVNGVETGRIRYGLYNGLETLLQLLVVEAKTRCHRQLRILIVLVKLHILNLLGCSCHIDELLFQTHLLLSEILVGANKLIVKTWIYLTGPMLILYLNSRWSKNLFR